MGDCVSVQTILAALIWFSYILSSDSVWITNQFIPSLTLKVSQQYSHFQVPVNTGFLRSGIFRPERWSKRSFMTLRLIITLPFPKVTKMSQNRRQTHTGSRWLKHIFSPLKGFIWKAKYREEGRQDSIINGTNQEIQKTQRGEWEYRNLYTMMRNKT